LPIVSMRMGIDRSCRTPGPFWRKNEPVLA
jgi:hypothetical protein